MQSVSPKLINMNLIIRKSVILMLFLSSSLSASSLTLLIETKDSMPREEMDIQEKTRVVSLESGVMDVLFEKGHIFFNMFSLKGDKSSFDSELEVLNYAEELGAGFLLVLDPDENGAAWHLLSVNRISDGGEGFVNLSETDTDKKPAERWAIMGTMLGEEVVPFIH